MLISSFLVFLIISYAHGDVQVDEVENLEHIHSPSAENDLGLSIGELPDQEKSNLEQGYSSLEEQTMPYLGSPLSFDTMPHDEVEENTDVPEQAGPGIAQMLPAKRSPPVINQQLVGPQLLFQDQEQLGENMQVQNPQIMQMLAARGQPSSFNHGVQNVLGVTPLYSPRNQMGQNVEVPDMQNLGPMQTLPVMGLPPTFIPHLERMENIPNLMEMQMLPAVEPMPPFNPHVEGTENVKEPGVHNPETTQKLPSVRPPPLFNPHEPSVEHEPNLVTMQMLPAAGTRPPFNPQLHDRFGENMKVHEGLNPESVPNVPVMRPPLVHNQMLNNLRLLAVQIKETRTVEMIPKLSLFNQITEPSQERPNIGSYKEFMLAIPIHMRQNSQPVTASNLAFESGYPLRTSEIPYELQVSQQRTPEMQFMPYYPKQRYQQLEYNNPYYTIKPVQPALYDRMTDPLITKSTITVTKNLLLGV